MKHFLSRVAGIDLVHVPYEGAEPVGSTPEAFREYVRGEIEKRGQVICAYGARFD